MSETIIAAIITGACSLIVGFFGGYAACYTKNVKNIQKAGKHSTQIQVGSINGK